MRCASSSVGNVRSVRSDNRTTPGSCVRATALARTVTTTTDATDVMEPPSWSRPAARAAPPLRGRRAQVPRAARTGPPIRAGVSTRATRRARDHRRPLQPSRFPSKLAVATRRWFRSDARGSPTLSGRGVGAAEPRRTLSQDATGGSSSCAIRSSASFFNSAESVAIARSPARSGCGTRRSSASTSSCKSASVCWRLASAYR